MNLSSKVTTKDFALLLALEANPSMSISELAERLKTSRPTVKKRLQLLKEQGIIKTPMAVYKPEALGLVRCSIIAFVNKLKNVEQLEVLCNNHPYTTYRSRLFGGNFGLFMQFDVPKQGEKKLEQLFKILEKKGLVSSFELYCSTGKKVRSFFNVEKFDLNTSTWDFSWKKWFMNLQRLETKKKLDTSIKTTYNGDIKELHLKILRDLTANASIKQTDLQKKYSLSKSEISRQYNHVLENYVETIRIIYDRFTFDLTETYLMVVENVSKPIMGKIYQHIKQSPPPFNFVFDVIGEDKFLMWISLSSAQANDLAFNTWELFEKSKIYVLSLRGKFSSVYWFYDENYDFSKNKWKDSDDYFILNPLKSINLSF